MQQASAQVINVKGQVVDTQQKPLSFVTVQSETLGLSTYTNEQGFFQVRVDTSRYKSFDLKIKMVGKQTVSTIISSFSTFSALKYELKDLNLSLDEIQVTEVRKAQSSNSSIVFDRQAIEQVQAFSLADVLNNLPGKTVTPPGLQNPKNITLRSLAGGIHELNNAFGTAIVLDDIQLSNNANMQNRSVGKFGIASSGIQSRSFGGFDVPFGGIDIREIPADNIESIEVISGIAPSKYGDLTDGAIIINRQAGNTKYQFSSRINAGSSNFSLSKGYVIGKKAGAVNFSMNYLNSEEDPSDPLKSYERVGTNVMWTSYLSSNFKNTLSADYSTRLDDVKLDPDVGRDYMTYAKSRNLSISNRSSLSFNSDFLKSVNLSFGYSSGYQETYNQSYINGAPYPVADKDTIGLYEGYYAPGSYLAVEHLIGRPLNMNGNLSLNSELKTGRLIHKLSLGSNIYYSENNGKGVIVDPEKERWENQGYQNERPYDYESVPSTFNYSLYVDDQFKFNFLRRSVNVNAGLRYDVQNNWGTIQPRLNLRYNLSKSLDFNAAFGISTKAPSLSMRYPAPIYFDLPVHNSYTGYTIESLYLVYTDKITPDNSSLHPSKTNQLEFGLNYTSKMITSSLFAYYKESKDGFSNQNNFRTYTTPLYTYVYNQGQRPDYYQNGLYKNWVTSYFTSANDLNSDNYGAEWSISTKKIKAIETSFSLNTSFSYSLSKNQFTSVIKANDLYINDDNKAWFGIYNADKAESYAIMSKLTTTTHIPKLGFVVNLLTDVFWQKQSGTLNASYLPIAYLDKNLVRYEIPVFDANDKDYNYLATSSRANSTTKQPFVYANLSVRVAKEIGKNIRMSVNAYNVFNIRNRYYNPNSDSVTTYTYPVSVGAELSVKF
ncbi:TonB-dependent receptor [Pedobacter metabolipauper]|uniref:Outer membrane receptor protein involved in Fe transport n=1 Tax=Pedobacter metabolipauper TaxID=425513 RepID=A0A4R6T0R2_9SPHI|nr:TonB-dependent receptor [Pedobacter metabolipauper]TDQ11629.1 outer membrane receptor protein involved in Fe transport [Pedobacter metabolipauper]